MRTADWHPGSRLNSRGGWITFTAVALVKGANGDFDSDRNLMSRSYVLTLRAWKYAITNTVEVPAMDIYRNGCVVGVVAEYYRRGSFDTAIIILGSCLERLLAPRERSKIANRFIQWKNVEIDATSPVRDD